MLGLGPIHFTDGNTEAQKHHAVCLSSQLARSKVGFESMNAGPQNILQMMTLCPRGGQEAGSLVSGRKGWEIGAWVLGRSKGQLSQEKMGF